MSELKLGDTTMHELLTPEDMGRADQLAIVRGPFSGFQLMENAGRAVAGEILRRFGQMAHVNVLCGPGNNGGDGYVIAAELHQSGMTVSLYASAPPKKGSDAQHAKIHCPLEPKPIDAFSPTSGTMVVDALFGAGLERPLAGSVLEAMEKTQAAGCVVVAVDLPSGLSGASGRVLGNACAADLTVTFFRKKPGHLLEPGRALCGEIVLADIGIAEAILNDVQPNCFENRPNLWRMAWPSLALGTHKYARGAVGVFSGGPFSTGAARLSAMSAQRAGAGAVTVYSPANAMQVNACHLTSIMLTRLDNTDELAATLRDNRIGAYVLGPGFGVGEKIREFAAMLLDQRSSGEGEAALLVLVLDADGITSFASDPEALFDRSGDGPALVLTPHEREFGRMFPDLSKDPSLSKLDRARKAAERSGATIVYKGRDTVIAAPDGRAAINSNGTPWLATAGSGDVLAGIVAALAAQGMPIFEAACAAVWLHAETGRLAGQGSIAEDFVQLLPAASATVI